MTLCYLRWTRLGLQERAGPILEKELIEVNTLEVSEPTITKGPWMVLDLPIQKMGWELQVQGTGPWFVKTEGKKCIF